MTRNIYVWLSSKNFISALKDDGMQVGVTAVFHWQCESDSLRSFIKREKTFHIFVFSGMELRGSKFWGKAARSVGRTWIFSFWPSTMPTSSTRGRGGCLRLLSCWTGCFGSILPCLAAKPLSMPQEPAMQAINVDISMPIRRSFTTEEEYQEALIRWKRDSVNILTSQMHSSVTAGTWTPAMMNQL